AAVHEQQDLLEESRPPEMVGHVRTEDVGQLRIGNRRLGREKSGLINAMVGREAMTGKKEIETTTDDTAEALCLVLASHCEQVIERLFHGEDRRHRKVPVGERRVEILGENQNSLPLRYRATITGDDPVVELLGIVLRSVQSRKVGIEV